MTTITQQLAPISNKAKHALFWAMRDYYEKIGQHKKTNYVPRPFFDPVVINKKMPTDITMSEFKLWQVNQEDFSYTSSYFVDLPHYLGGYFANRYEKLFNNKGRRTANTFLRKTLGGDIKDRLALARSKYVGDKPSILSLRLSKEFTDLPTYNRKQIEKLAYHIANLMNDLIFFDVEHHDFALSTENATSGTPSHQGYLTLVKEMLAIKITPPYYADYKNDNLTEDKAAIAIAKVSDPQWWLNQLKRRRDIVQEHLAIAVGQVQNVASPYASRLCVNEWHEQKRKNRDWINSQAIENKETGEQFELSLMVDKSNANPAIRRCELMVRMRGFEDIADELGYIGAFITLTAPSKYHACHSKGGFVENWMGNNPRDTQKYLCNVWARIRASLSRADIKYFGFRVAEPHHDGTPHWHILIFMKPEHRAQVEQTMRFYALQENGSENGAQENRFKFVDIDKEKGSATGYIAKYISKNIDGYALDGETDDETGQDLKKMAKAVTAWASRWRIRQFQQLGGAPVTVWRELRRLKDKKVTDENIDPVLAAADIGDWAAYTEHQGGAMVKRKDLKVRTSYEESINDFNEPIKKVKGVYSPLTGLASFICTRLIKWAIVSKKRSESDPRSSVNNCTEPKTVIKPKKRSAIDKLIEDLDLRDISIDEFIKKPSIRSEKPIKKELKDKLREQTYLEEIEKRNKQVRTTIVDHKKLKKQIINELEERNLLTKDYIISGLLAGHLVCFNNNLAIKLVGCELIYLALPAYDSNDDDKNLMRTDMKSVMYGNIENMEKEYQTSKKEKKGYQKIYDNIIKDSKTVALDLLLKAMPKRKTFDDVTFDF